MAPVNLTARGLSRRFGGLVAVADVSIELRPGLPHAVIGPNGAGKSTLINLLSGALHPDEGTIHLNGDDITPHADWRRARAGVGRSFQRTSLFAALPVRENVRLAAQAMTRGRGLLAPARTDAATMRLADAALRQVGLADRSEILTNTLSHGERRLLEIALVLATQARVLLLDEPLAGLGPEETAPVVALLGALGETHAMLLVEHDMDVVFAVAREVTVMVDGRVLETGSPESVRKSPVVRDAYLGHRA